MANLLIRPVKQPSVALAASRGLAAGAGERQNLLAEKQLKSYDVREADRKKAAGLALETGQFNLDRLKALEPGVRQNALINMIWKRAPNMTWDSYPNDYAFINKTAQDTGSPNPLPPPQQILQNALNAGVPPAEYFEKVKAEQIQSVQDSINVSKAEAERTKAEAPAKKDWQTFYDKNKVAHTIDVTTEYPDKTWDENKPAGKASQFKTFYDDKNKPHTIDVTTQTPDPAWSDTRAPKGGQAGKSQVTIYGPVDPDTNKAMTRKAAISKDEDYTPPEGWSLTKPETSTKDATLQNRLRLQVSKLFGFNEFAGLDEATADKVARASVLARGYIDAGDNLDVAAKRAFSEVSEGYEVLGELPQSKTGTIFQKDTAEETKAILEKLPQGTPTSVVYKALISKGWTEEEAKALIREINAAATAE